MDLLGSGSLTMADYNEVQKVCAERKAELRDTYQAQRAEARATLESLRMRTRRPRAEAAPKAKSKGKVKSKGKRRSKPAIESALGEE